MFRFHKSLDIISKYFGHHICQACLQNKGAATFATRKDTDTKTTQLSSINLRYPLHSESLLSLNKLLPKLPRPRPKTKLQITHIRTSSSVPNSN